MFCIKCGKKADVENLCENCFLSSEELFKIEDFILFVCDCGSYYDRKWKDPEEEKKIIVDQISRKIKTRNKILSKSIDIKKSGNRIIATVSCRGVIKPAKGIKREEKTITITLKKRKCDTCVKILGGYYEAVLQLRGRNSEKILNRVKADNITVMKSKQGYDIRFMKKSEAKKNAKQLKRLFVVKESFKFVATKKGKRLYRNYYSIK